MSPHFTSCAATYINSPDLIAKYNYSGPTVLIPRNSSTQITYEGCLAVCGPGAELYTWAEAAGTITTWILPVIGVLLQAPFQSNEFWATIFFIFRLIGSPVSTLSYSLWNIKVSGRCAMLVDMAIGYDEYPDDESEPYGNIRDSFTLLINMNQYQMKSIAEQKECESVLRIMLFSSTLRLNETDKSITTKRHEIAQVLRKYRRRGVVPVFVSIGWFMFAMVLSIQDAFGHLGQNAVAHDLATGLLLSWLPNVILTSIVDRNPAAADDVREQLNEFVDLICDSLECGIIREEYIQGLERYHTGQELRAMVEHIPTLASSVRGEFFKRFAGQGRVRWHYGAAHPILCDIEDCYIASKIPSESRKWLANEEEARVKLVLGKVGDKGLLWFDYRGLWQILTATAYINGSIVGAFLLSYFTPTVGLGCRSGSYMVFALVADALFLSEMLVWWLSSPVSKSMRDRTAQGLVRVNSVVAPPDSRAYTGYEKIRLMAVTSKKYFMSILATLAAAFYYPHRCFLGGESWSSVREQATHDVDEINWTSASFTAVEMFNTVWICKTIFSQTFGTFNTCACQSSLWSSIGGYMDLTQWDFSTAPGVAHWWAVGTAVTLTFMGLLMAYLVLEWCIQAHLCTSCYKKSIHGLRRTRLFRRCLHPIRYPLARAVMYVNYAFARLAGKANAQAQLKEVMWTAKWRRRSGSGRAGAAGDDADGIDADGGDAAGEGFKHQGWVEEFELAPLQPLLPLTLIAAREGVERRGGVEI